MIELYTQSPYSTERRKRKWINGRFPSAGDHQVCVIVTYEIERITNGMCAGCACRGHCMIGSSQSIAHGNMSGRQIEQNFGYEMGTQASVAAILGKLLGG